MKSLIVLFLSFFGFTAISQEPYYQTVRGQVIDLDSKKPLAGVTVKMLNDNTFTDSMGYFVLKQVPLGRQFITTSSVGYDASMSEVIVISGKENFITINLNQQVKQLETVIVSGLRNRSKPTNEFAGPSARSFAVDETKRYAAAAYDPARMAMNFAGVSNNGDMYNEIVVRGNSPKGILWRLEGIEIPNPNHFGTLGNTGGAISMLSSSTLAKSDFYTGAFPAEFGAATSGVFDLNFRSGNNKNREYSFMIGGLGIEAAAEGPFSKGGRSSYLINYRYSTLSLLKRFVTLGGVMLDYQDLSFKFNFPLKNNDVITVFGLGGANLASKDAPKDSTVWADHDQHNITLRSRSKAGVAGASYLHFFRKDAYIKTILAIANSELNEKVDTLNPRQNYDVVEKARAANQDISYRLSVLYNNKINVNHVIKTGVIASVLDFGYNNKFYDRHLKKWKEILNANGSTSYLQGYFQWKYRMSNQLSVISGLHFSFFTLNNTSSFEPRLSVNYKSSNSESFQLAAGLHAKPEHLSLYMFRSSNTASESLPNKNLKIPKAFHLVGSYEKMLSNSWSVKAEVYWQQLWHVPVEDSLTDYFSAINVTNIDGLLNASNLVSNGRGKNYGIDLTVERPFRNNYYSLLTASLFNSTYTSNSGKEYSTKYNRNYQINWVAGKEWQTGSSGKNVLSVNWKILTSGGLRDSPVDLPASRQAGKLKFVNGKYYTLQGGTYFRADVGVSYRINKKASTHTISLDIQNITNHQNLYSSWYDEHSGGIKKIYQMGIFPILNYRIEFRTK